MSEQKKREQVVFLIDVANCRNLDFGQMYQIAQQHGELLVARAYGNYANSRDLGEAALKLFTLGVQLIHCPAWRNGSGEWKSCSDEALMSEARTLLFTEEEISKFIIASGDGHFVTTLCEIKKRGKKAIVMTGRGRAGAMLKEAADEVILLSPMASPVPKEIYQTLVQAIQLLQRAQRRSAVHPGRVKEKMIELLGEFDEKMYRDRKNRPFKKFSEFLKEAQAQGWIRLIQQDNDLLVTTAAERSRSAPVNSQSEDVVA
jgi:uncharacterized LabA/DUF88 family protein